jgi:hypothetical protein
MFAQAVDNYKDQVIVYADQIGQRPGAGSVLKLGDTGQDSQATSKIDNAEPVPRRSQQGPLGKRADQLIQVADRSFR